MSLQKIVFCTDFSESAATALTVANAYAVRLRADLYLLNVRGSLADVGLNEASYPLFGQYETLVDDLSRRQLAELQIPDGVRVVRETLANASISAGIMEYAELIGADLIIVGSHGHGTLVRLLLGSIPEQLVRLAPCPVLVVPTRHRIGETALSPEIVLAPWDLSQDGAAGMPLAAALARELSARLMLVHVADRRALPALGLTGEQTVFGVFPAFEALAKNRMHAWAREYAEELEVEIVVREGRPHLVLAGLAEDLGAGLVVVSALGLGAETRKLLGSTVGKLLRVSPCPVLVVR